MPTRRPRQLIAVVLVGVLVALGAVTLASAPRRVSPVHQCLAATLAASFFDVAFRKFR